MTRLPTDSSMRKNARNRDSLRGQSRRGMVFIGVLIVLAVVSTLVVGWISNGFARRGHDRQAEQRLQAEWLAESALERAAARLAADPSYSGEAWSIAAAELSQPEAGRIEIHVARIADRPGAREISVVADYPADSQRRSRIEKQVVVGP